MIVIAITWPTASRLREIWKGRHDIRNWWWVLPIAVLVHAKIVVGWERPQSLGKVPIRIRLRSGCRISCRANEIFQIVEVFISSNYENPEISYLEAHTVLDVGANIGVATIWFSERCPLARIFAIEPSSETVAPHSKYQPQWTREPRNRSQHGPGGGRPTTPFGSRRALRGFLTPTPNLMRAARSCGQPTSRQSLRSLVDMWMS